MWFDRRLVVRSSSLHGYGMFSTEPIRVGEELIWVFGGVVYTIAEMTENYLSYNSVIGVTSRLMLNVSYGNLILGN